MSDLVYSSVSTEPLVRLPELTHQFELTGLRVNAVPPGKIDASYRLDNHLIDCNIEATRSWMSYGSDRVREIPSAARTIACCEAGVDATLRVHNPDYVLAIEVDPLHAALLTHETLDGTPFVPEFRGYEPGGDVSAAAFVLLRAIRSGSHNRLLMEGLALAIVGGAIELQHGSPVRAVSTQGTDARIARAIDYVETNLANDLSIAELAAVAAMSPSWFRECFAAVTGRSVHAYVLERRLQRARHLLEAPRYGPLRSRPAIQQVAYACGFADQSHLTRAFKRRYGTTPGTVLREQ